MGAGSGALEVERSPRGRAVCGLWGIVDSGAFGVGELFVDRFTVAAAGGDGFDDVGSGGIVYDDGGIVFDREPKKGTDAGDGISGS